MKEQDILRFWRDVEIFDLPDLNKDAALISISDTLPWLHKVSQPKKNYKWRYTLFFGKLDKKIILEHLNTLLKADTQNNWEEPIQGFSCLSALILDEDGRPQHDSYVTASYTFGIKALENNTDLSYVSQYIEQAKEDFLERYNIPKITKEIDSPAKGDVVQWPYLHKEIDYLTQLTPWWKDDIKIFLFSEEVPKDSEPSSGFLNSFYLDDLNYLSYTEQKNSGIAFQQYLMLQPSVKIRKDLIQNRQFLFDTIDPSQMTSGRWPSNIKYGLYSAQAGAVNTIFSNLRNSAGLQGINGPPGTGKTTLLLDVIAEIIVERAKIISQLGCDKIFEERSVKIEKESGFTLYTYDLKPSLKKNFGIVVASNNNAAVENISKELPLKAKIDTSVFPDADYFSEYATKLIDEESWGILAAALGNSKNRQNFRKSFWQSNKNEGIIGFHDLLHNIYKDPQNEETHIYYNSFVIQNEKFQSLLYRFEQFKTQAGRFHKQLPIFIDNKDREARINTELKKIKKELARLLEEKQIAETQEIRVQEDAGRMQLLLQLHRQRKPSFFFFRKLFNTASFKKWDTEAAGIISPLKTALSKLDNLKQQLNNNHTDTQRLSSQQEKHKAELSHLMLFFTAYQKLQTELMQEYEIDAGNLFNAKFYKKDIQSIQLSSPYHSPAIAKLRSDIFITALQIHHDAILANAKKIRNNLNAYFEMTAGWVKVNRGITQNLWDTFFLCVPVASTTLASASRLFSLTDKEQIGWLLIDEAGQATPQSAAGLIYRAKRCVIVGDPLQVEPVITIPEKLITKLRNEHAVPVDWSPYRVSVQQLADRVSLSGTYMNLGDTDEKIWTGFPLRTHRRCDNPMFSIANKIAYNNQMVKATAIDSAETFIGPSCWFNVHPEQATLTNKHVVREEIILLTQKIRELRNTGYHGDIYVISPFRSIATYCSNEYRDDKKVSCGTIHKFQGKEADIVFLILGSDPKSSGARAWAAQKPNMLNVALTRAKKRFYVIGNKKLWASYNYFSTMANEIY